MKYIYNLLLQRISPTCVVGSGLSFPFLFSRFSPNGAGIIECDSKKLGSARKNGWDVLKANERMAARIQKRIKLEVGNFIYFNSSAPYPK